MAAARRARARRRRSRGRDSLSRAEQWIVREVDGLLSTQPSAAVAVLVGGEPAALAHSLAIGFPRATVTSFPVASTSPSLHAKLAAAGPFRAIVVTAEVASECADLAALYRSVLFHLMPRGRLLFVEFHPGRGEPGGLWPLMHRLIRLREADAVEPVDADDRALAVATKSVVINGTSLAVANGTACLAKLRENEVDYVLSYRGRRAGAVLDRIEPEVFQRRGLICDHGAESRRRELKPMVVPRLSLRQYDSAYCVPRQITLLGNLLLPDTYRHHLRSRLVTSGTREISPLFAQVAMDIGKARDVEGSVFQWDSEWSGHFGHLMTEQLSRLWGWRNAKSRYPDLRVVLYKKHATDQPSPWERGLLGAAGIDADEAVVIAGPIHAERVIAATPMFSMPYYISPQITAIWDEVGKGAQLAAGPHPTPSRIFVSRRRQNRWCNNRDDVERTFAQAGFTVVFPEDLPFADQVAVFRNAELVAGFAGSAMFTLGLCDTPKRVLLLSSEHYIPHNECMISAVRGHQLDIFWSVPDRWEVNASFSFDFDREGRHLRRVLAELI
jgi:capsular polysaccharide biosynthesis protein